jgi:ketosteroid isomerase-like protein
MALRRQKVVTVIVVPGSYEPSATRGPFPPIAEYAFLSDCEATALVAPSGNVEWLCLPRADSPSVFAAILDRAAGGFRIGPADVAVPAARRYLPGSLMLETTWKRTDMSNESNENVALIRGAYDAYARGDLATMLEVVDPDLEWTYLDPSLEDPQPQVCHGRHELESALARQAGQGLRAQLEEVLGHGDRVMVVVRTPGVDAYRVRQADDRNYSVFTVRDGRVVALRDCRDRQEGLRLTGIQ